MKIYKVLDIEFDFSCDNDYPVPRQQQDKIKQDTLNRIFYAEDEFHLVDVISDETGWCVKSFSFQEV